MTPRTPTGRCDCRRGLGSDIVPSSRAEVTNDVPKCRSVFVPTPWSRSCCMVSVCAAKRISPASCRRPHCQYIVHRPHIACHRDLPRQTLQGRPRMPRGHPETLHGLPGADQALSTGFQGRPWSSRNSPRPFKGSQGLPIVSKGLPRPPKGFQRHPGMLQKGDQELLKASDPPPRAARCLALPRGPELRYFVWPVWMGLSELPSGRYWCIPGLKQRMLLIPTLARPLGARARTSSRTPSSAASPGPPSWRSSAAAPRPSPAQRCPASAPWRGSWGRRAATSTPLRPKARERAACAGVECSAGATQRVVDVSPTRPHVDPNSAPQMGPRSTPERFHPIHLDPASTRHGLQADPPHTDPRIDPEATTNRPQFNPSSPPNATLHGPRCDPQSTPVRPQLAPFLHPPTSWAAENPDV